jgi:hypothetical protein
MDEEAYTSKEMLPLIYMEIGTGSTVNKYSWERDHSRYGPRHLQSYLLPISVINSLDSYLVGRYQRCKGALEIKLIT